MINHNLDVAENMNVLLFKKVLPCPLRSQINHVKKTMFSETIKVGNEKPKDHKNMMIRSFLKEQAVAKLVPERELEISRVYNLLKQLKKMQKAQKDGKFEEALHKIKMKRCARNRRTTDMLSMTKNIDPDAQSFLKTSTSFMPKAN